MERFTFLSKSIDFKFITGEVLSNEKYSETKVSSSGGGGFVGKDGGYVSAPSVHSRSILNHEFWIRTKDGLEENFKLRGIDIPLREGQLITIISAMDKDESYPVCLINHNAKKHWNINSPAALINTLIPFSFFKKPVFYGLILILLFHLPFLVTEEWMKIKHFWPTHEWITITKFCAWVGIVLGPVYIVFKIIKEIRLFYRCEKYLQAHLEKLTNVKSSI